MKIIKINERKDFNYYKEEDLYFNLLHRTKHVSTSLDEMLPGAITPMHHHTRSEDGDEILFVFQGKFELEYDGKKGTFDTDKDGPVLIIISSEENKAMRNVGKNKLRFFSLFAPPHTPKESSLDK